MQGCCDFFEVGRRFFPNGDHSHFDSLIARRLQNKKRKLSVSGNQTPSGGSVRDGGITRGCRGIHLWRPRSADSINSTSSRTSCEPFSCPLLLSSTSVVS